MIDYDLVDPDVVKSLKTLGALKVKTIIECEFYQNTKDPVLIKGTERLGRLLLTRDKGTITRYKYKPCTHGGIIVIKAKHPTPQEVFRRVKALCRSGHKAMAVNHVTYLWEDKGTIYTHKEPITFSI